MTTRMSCSISSTVSPCSSRSFSTKRGEVRRLLRVHPGGRLVEEEELRLRRERARDLEPALVAVGEVLARVSSTFRRARSTRAARGRARARPRSSRLIRGVRRIAPRSRPCRRECIPTSTFSSAVMFWKRRMFWNVRPMPRCGDRVRRLAGDVVAVEDDPAGGRLVDAGEHVEERRLAGAVRADQADDRAARDREVDVVDGDEPAELLAQPDARRGCRRRWSSIGAASCRGAACRARPRANSALRLAARDQALRPDQHRSAR